VPGIAAIALIRHRVTDDDRILRLLPRPLSCRNSSKLTLALGTGGRSSPRLTKEHAAISAVDPIRPRTRLKARPSRLEPEHATWIVLAASFEVCPGLLRFF
jgi:hypothetical protein